MLPIAICLLAWSVDKNASSTVSFVKEEVKASTWGLDELGSIEWRRMMASLLKAVYGGRLA